MDVEGFINRLEAEAEREGIAQSTADRYAGYIKLFAEWGDFEPGAEPDKDDLREYVEYLAYEEGISNGTIRVRLAPVIRYARYAGIGDAEFSREWERIRSDYKPSAQDTPTFLEREEVEAMKEAAKPNPERVAEVLDGYDTSDITPEEREFLSRASSGDAREHAIICLLASTGIRIGELCGLTLDDIDLNPSSPPQGEGLSGYVRVERQKRKETVVDRLPIPDETVEALRTYISERESYLSMSGPSQLSHDDSEASTAAAESEAVFVTSSWSENSERRFGDGWAITPGYARTIVKRVARRAEVVVPGSEGDDVYPHLFRHTAASRLAQVGYSNVQIANWLGVEPSTADIYADISEEEMGEMAEAIE